MSVPTEAPVTKADKQSVIASLTKQLNKEHKTDTSLVRLGDRVGVPIPSFPTGLLSVDLNVIQCGGFPKGKIVEVLGPESAGKTSLCLQVVSSVQKRGGLAAYIDAEHALNPTHAANLGVNVDELYISQPDYGEQALQFADALIESRAIDIIIIDSVSALVPKAELEGEIGDASMGLQARMMSQAMRMLTAKANRNGTCVVFINQIREKIGVMFGSPETTSGGRALKFFASLRIDVRRKEQIKAGEVPIGNRMKIKAVKNKVGSPFRETEVDFFFTSGFDTAADSLKFAETLGILDKAGSWYSFQGEKLGQGFDAVKERVQEDDQLAAKIGAAIQKKLAEK